MRYLGIDYGSKRIGTAVSNDEGTIAFPRASIANDEHVLARISDMVKENKIDRLVMGDTRAFSGLENPVTSEADSFAHSLQEYLGIEVKKTWEAWSSREAGRFAPARARRAGGPKDKKSDSATAAIILQRFLDMRKS